MRISSEQGYVPGPVSRSCHFGQSNRRFSNSYARLHTTLQILTTDVQYLSTEAWRTYKGDLMCFRIENSDVVSMEFSVIGDFGKWDTSRKVTESRHELLKMKGLLTHIQGLYRGTPPQFYVQTNHVPCPRRKSFLQHLSQWRPQILLNWIGFWVVLQEPVSLNRTLTEWLTL